MEIKYFNLNSPVINKGLDVFKEVTEYDFWYNYLALININNPILSDKELTIVAYILSGNDEISYGKGEPRNKLTSDIGIDNTNYTKYINSLVLKGYLQFQGTRGDYLLAPTLRKFQKYIKDNIAHNRDFTYAFTLPFKIKSK